MATGSDRPKVTRHTTLWMGSNNLRWLCRNRSLHESRQGLKKNTKRQTWAFCVDRSRATAASYSWIRKKKPHVRIRGSYFPQLVGGRFICLRQSPSSLFNESDWTYPLLFIITEIEILFLFTDFFVFGKHNRRYYFTQFSFWTSSFCDLAQWAHAD